MRRLSFGAHDKPENPIRSPVEPRAPYSKATNPDSCAGHALLLPDGVMPDRQQRSRRSSLAASTAEPEPTPFVTVKPTRDAERLASKQRTFCKAVIKTMFADEQSLNFQRPVMEMWSPAEIPGYAKQIKHPMDLGTIQGMLENKGYADDRTGLFNYKLFAADVCLTFDNCCKYNGESTDMHKIATQFLAWFRAEMAKMPGASGGSGVDEPSVTPEELDRLKRQLEELHAERAEVDSEIAKSDVERSMPLSEDERIQLRDDIEKLPWERCRRVVDLLQAEVNAAIAEGAEEAPEFVDIDLDNVDPPILRTVSEFIHNTPANTKRTEAMARLSTIDKEIAAVEAALPPSMRRPPAPKKRERSRDREREREKRRKRR
jgi:Bromodomain/Bromodomain extra-terminal - transcription regulation